MEEEKPSDDVIVDGDDSQEQPSDDVTVESDDTDLPEEKTEQPLDRPQYNIDAEVERKLSNKLEEIIPKIAEAVKENKQQQYTIEQLEQFRANTDDPANIAYANAEIRKLEREELRKELRSEREQYTKQQQNQILKQQAEAQVLSDPAYEEAFIQTANGKSWNQNSRLAQMASQLHSQDELKNRPDGIAIAMELAYARLSKSGQLQTVDKLKTLKRQNQKLKKQTLTEGGGVNKQVSSMNDYQKAVGRLAQTGKDADAVAAFNAYRKARK